jgi:hypothetical protein
MITTPVSRATSPNADVDSPREPLRRAEVFVILRLAKVLRPKKFGQTDNLRTLFRGIANEGDGAFEILLRLRAAPHLDERDSGLLRFHGWIVRSAHDVKHTMAKRSK